MAEPVALNADPSQEEVAELLLLGKWLRPGKVTVAVPPDQPARFLVDPDQVQAVMVISPLSPAGITVEYADVHGVRIATVRRIEPGQRAAELFVVGRMVMMGMTSAIGPLTTP